ncbi:hypothetical protein DPMN_162047 [Dreissena polymorpha]|uniref:Uncharacterized protein n=1 Tax=Dreissena polymorpha TaxID=45954 RepID=A0A9D4EQR8_DREPO|nr:hypothetical protein DPMN_162047 [Dreissena polymorpha]
MRSWRRLELPGLRPEPAEVPTALDLPALPMRSGSVRIKFEPEVEVLIPIRFIAGLPSVASGVCVG